MLVKRKWNVKFNKQVEYHIIQTENLFHPDNKALLTGGRLEGSRRFIVIDDFIYTQYRDKIEGYFDQNKVNAHIFPYESGEKNKNIENFEKIFTALCEYGVDRRGEPLIAIGGGVTTDITGFVASCYRRGIPHIKVPTTLMGYVDASVGIKTGINFNHYKNRMGTFDASLYVILDKSFFKSQDRRHLLNGVGEILKLAVIKDKTLFYLLEEQGEDAINYKFQKDNSDIILSLAIEKMIEELEPNLFEDNLERSVDFGHTFSPALEMYDITNLLHGEAVAIDVAFSSVLAYNRGLLSSNEKNRIINLMKKLGLPYTNQYITASLFWDSVLERKQHRDGFQRIPLPASIGQCVFINDITYEELSQACQLMKEI